jgi:hypothetical protein
MQNVDTVKHNGPRYSERDQKHINTLIRRSNARVAASYEQVIDGLKAEVARPSAPGKIDPPLLSKNNPGIILSATVTNRRPYFSEK